MICIKCNNEIPDGAKFCPSCGASAQAAPAAAAAPETEKKIYCEKCGLELMNGAKFCSVCGGSGVARDTVPTAAAPFGNEISPAVVDLNKPSQSDSLVSAMNGVSAAASNAPIPGVPMPSNDVPVPANGVPAPSNGSSVTSGYAASAPSPVIPPYVASVSADAQQAPVMPMPAMSGAAAVSAKKVNGGKIALFSVLGVLIIAIATAAVMFFTNRASFLSTFMGKAKYATMIEGTSIKNATEKLDIPAIANGIKSASGTYQAMTSTMYGLSNPYMNYIGGSSITAPMSYSDIDPEFNAGFNVSELSKSLADMMQSYYGADTVSESLSMNVQLSDSVKAMLGAGNIDVDKYLDLLNGTTVNYTLSAKDNKSAVSIGTKGGITVNAKILLDGQDVYAALPFASDKAILISVPGYSGGIKTEVKPLELDEKEIERLITECVEIYLDYYKSASIEMENGEINAAGVTVNGKLITAEFKGEQLCDLFTDIAKHIVSDDYLMTQIADYANSCGAETTKKELTDKALDNIEYVFGDIGNDDKLVIETVIDRNGNVLGKTVKAMEGEDVFAEFTYAETKDQLGFEINSYDDEVSFKVTVDKIDDKSGSCKIKVVSDDEETSFVLNYSDVKKAEFCGKDIYTGNFSFGMSLPESFSDQLGKDAWAAVNGAKLNLGLAADSKNTLEYTIAVEVPSYGSISFKDVFTVLNDDSAFTKPTDVIDITDAMLNGMPDESTKVELEKFAEDVENAFKNAVPEFIANSLENLPGSMIGGIDSPTVYPGSSSISDDVADLLDDIKDDMEDIQKALNGELTYDRTLTSSTELEAMLSEYTGLYLEIIAKGDMTIEEFNKFDDRYWDLYFELPYFSDDLGTMPGFNDPRLNDLSENLAECYIDAYEISVYMEKLGELPEAKKLYDDIEKAFADLMNYCESTGAYDLDGYTDAQLTEVERLLDIVEDKIDAFRDKYAFD